MKLAFLPGHAFALSLLAGCATSPTYDYSAFRQAQPASILVLPPVNDSLEVRATYSMLALVTRPLAESGYYVLPVTLVEETFKQNGLTQPAEIADVPLRRLLEVFGADAVLYIRIKQYEISHPREVSAEARLVDLRSGILLWEGEATKTGGTWGSIKQVVVDLMFEAAIYLAAIKYERSHEVARLTSNLLLQAGRRGGLLYGPRSPKYQQDLKTKP